VVQHHHLCDGDGMTLITFEDGKAVFRDGKVDARGLPCGCCTCSPSFYVAEHKGLVFDIYYYITIPASPGDCGAQVLEGTLVALWNDADFFPAQYYGETTSGAFKIEGAVALSTQNDGSPAWLFSIVLDVDSAVCCVDPDGFGGCLTSRYGPFNFVSGCAGCGTCFPPPYIALDADNNDSFGNEWPRAGVIIEGLCEVRG
jgi:hypothetical protein